MEICLIIMTIFRFSPQLAAHTHDDADDNVDEEKRRYRRMQPHSFLSHTASPCEAAAGGDGRDIYLL